MTINEQVAAAVAKVKGLFGPPEEVPQLPEDATVESLWKEILHLRRELSTLKRAKRGVKPRVEDAVRVLLEDPELAEVPLDMVGEIVKEVFQSMGLPCNCSGNSVRWYSSQRNMEWNIVPRRLPRLEVHRDTEGQ